jgi:hypothetical protein
MTGQLLLRGTPSPFRSSGSVCTLAIAAAPLAPLTLDTKVATVVLNLAIGTTIAVLVAEVGRAAATRAEMFEHERWPGRTRRRSVRQPAARGARTREEAGARHCPATNEVATSSATMPASHVFQTTHAPRSYRSMPARKPASWIAATRHGPAVAWLSLERRDDDADRFSRAHGLVQDYVEDTCTGST